MLSEHCVFCGDPGVMRSTNDVMCDKCADYWLPDGDESKVWSREDANVAIAQIHELRRDIERVRAENAKLRGLLRLARKCLTFRDEGYAALGLEGDA